MIHILIPTRGRPERLMATMRSLAETADDRKSFEVLLRVDDDDSETARILTQCHSLCSCFVLHGDRPDSGYNSIHHLYSELTDLVPEHHPIWIMNDDCTVEGKAWDSDILAHFPFESYIAQPETVINGHSSYTNIPDGPFPIVPNKCWEKFGHKGFGNNLDVWLHDLLVKENGWLVHYMKGITVNHQRRIDSTLTKERF